MRSGINQNTDNIAWPWLPSPAVLTLPDDEVHVWRASLQQPEAQIENLQKLLSPEELRRAERFRFQKHRDHFTVGRGLLRVILARYDDTPPAQLHFSAGPHGKPLLDSAFHRTEISFNLSHSDGVALYAIARNRDVGVDIECCSKEFDCSGIGEQFFSGQERELWRSSPQERSREVFFSCWTRKEALLKGMGVGLSVDPRTIDTIGEPGEMIRIKNPAPGPDEYQQWSVVDLAPGCGYTGALAVQGEGWQAKYWQFSEI